MIAADYPFLDVLWTLLIFFAWVIWFWLLITVFADIFRRRDIGGGKKALWVIFVIIIPFVGVLIYLIAESNGMADRQAETPATGEVADRRVHQDGRRERRSRPGRSRRRSSCSTAARSTSRSSTR